MNKKLLALIALAATPQAFAQTTSYVFQNGTPVRGFQGGVQTFTGAEYTGTDDTEFTSADLTSSGGTLGENTTMTVDGSDGGNVAQGAIRFNDLLAGLPQAVATGVQGGQLTIANARLEYWKASGTTGDAQIAFHQVIREDNKTGEFWKEDDSWGDTVNELGDIGINNTFVEWPFGPADGPQFSPEGFTLTDQFGTFVYPDEIIDPAGPFNDPFGYQDEVATTEINPSTNRRQIYFESTEGAEVTFSTFGGGTTTIAIADEEDTITDQDSENILDILDDSVIANEISFVDAFNASFISTEVTDTVIDWLVDGAPAQGWSISNNTTDGWDIFTSEAEGQETGQNGGSGLFEGDLDLTGDNLALFDSLIAGDGLPLGLKQLQDAQGTIIPNRIALDGIGLRPKLIIDIAGPGGPADFNLSGATDLADYELFLQAFGGQIDGPVGVGSTGDLDFDGDVDSADFLRFKELFVDAQNMSLAEALAVPEPTTAVLTFVAAAGFAARRRRNG
ncbi:MAG: PEP-CTERM sorting domain-containing protein [Planctomycetota bacterium]